MAQNICTAHKHTAPKTVDMKSYNLMPNAHDGVKSFYGKAKVHEYADGFTYLRSYETVVVKVDTVNRRFIVNGWYSTTTARHINSFVRSLTGRGYSKAELNAMAGKPQTY